MPGDKGVPKDKTFTKLHQAVWKEDVDAVKKFVKIDRTSSEYGDNKFGSGGKKRLKLAASTFAAGAKLEYDILINEFNLIKKLSSTFYLIFL